MIVKFAQTTDDINKIIELRYRILRKPWEQPKETSTDGLETFSYNAFIEDNEGKIIACGRLQENANKIGQIRYMAVDEIHQGKGLGKLILSSLENKAIEIGLKYISLQARENALQFYKNSNYQLREKSFKLWDIIQHYLMFKEL